jgi:hypothetical protein
MSMRRVALMAAPILLASLAPHAKAQVLYGSIVGNVTDASKASVPSAVVRLTQVETNLSHEVLINQAGAYTYNDAPSGTYLVAISKEGGTSPYFNPLAFAQPTCVCFGTSGYNILRGPFYFDWDQSVFRYFQLAERFGLEFRAEGFNMANHPHFANPAANVSSLQLNSAGQVANLNGFGVVTTVNTGGRDFDECYFRLGLRLSF